MRRLFCLLAAVLAQFSASPTEAQESLVPQVAQRLAQGSFREYLEFLSLPNDAIVPADIQKNVDWLERAFRKRRFVVKQLENKGKPMLYAEWPKRVVGAKTVLYYST